jgi:hypothetical protein
MRKIKKFVIMDDLVGTRKISEKELQALLDYWSKRMRMFYNVRTFTLRGGNTISTITKKETHKE